MKGDPLRAPPIVGPVVIDGVVDHWELVACNETLGEFTIDDNEELVARLTSFEDCFDDVGRKECAPEDLTDVTFRHSGM